MKSLEFLEYSCVIVLSMLKINQTKHFKKEFGNVDVYIQRRFAERLKLLVENPSHPLLKKHHLYGKYSKSMSINITGDWRIIFQYVSHDTIELQRIGTHSQLYK